MKEILSKIKKYGYLNTVILIISFIFGAFHIYATITGKGKSFPIKAGI